MRAFLLKRRLSYLDLLLMLPAIQILLHDHLLIGLLAMAGGLVASMCIEVLLR